MEESAPKEFEKDKLGLYKFSQNLLDFILVDHQFTDGALVVSLDGQFGAGKSFFLRMWSDYMANLRLTDGSLPIPVVVNAWESDYCGEPLTAILSELIAALDRLNLNNDESKNQAFKDGIKDCLWFGIGLLNDFTSKIGPNAIAAAELAESKKAKRSKRPDFIELYASKKKAFEDLKTKLRDRFGGQHPKAIIMIDELDRCRPDYAVHYLEVIKHIFDVHGLVFVLAVDSQHLANSTRALFGQDLVFDEYFRKFAQRRFRLPKPRADSLLKLVDTFTDRYLEYKNCRSSMIQVGRRREDIANLCASAEMTPRQMQEMFRILGHITSCTTDRQGQMFWGIQLGTIFMCALKVKNAGHYERIAAGNPDHEVTIKFLNDVGGTNKALWWFKVYLAGLQSAKNRFDSIAVLGRHFSSQALISQSDMEKFSDAWGDVDRHESGFGRIHRIIESISKFGENW